MRDKMKRIYIFSCMACFLLSAGDLVFSPLSAFDNKAFAAGQRHEAYIIRPVGQTGNPSSARRHETTSNLERPTILSPEEIAEYRDIYDVQVRWSTVPRGAFYHVVLARDRTFRYIIYDNPDVANTTLTFWNLDYGTYFLKISAVSKEGAEGPFSDTVSFIVVPPVPMITAE